MPVLLLLALAILAATPARAQERTLAWTSLRVEARLESDGTLRVTEHHEMRFHGPWNGGERIFRAAPGQQIELLSVQRVDAAGRSAPMAEAVGSGIGLHQYRFDGTTLRWRARRADDPPFHGETRTTIIEYAMRNVVARDGDAYLLNHDFGLPDRSWPMERFAARIELDPAWQAPEDFEAAVQRDNVPPGTGVVLTTRLRYAGEGQPLYVADPLPPPPRPAPVHPTVTRPPLPPPEPPPMLPRLATLALFAAAALLMTWWFIRSEQARGRYEEWPAVTPEWLEEHLLVHRAEVVGAAWDGATGHGEVSALLATMEAEGKIAMAGPEPTLRLLVPVESLSPYEQAFVRALFVAGDEINPEKLRRHYAGTGFDPAASIGWSLHHAARKLVGTHFSAGAWMLGIGVFVVGLIVSVTVASGFIVSFLLAVVYRTQFHGRVVAAMIPVPILLGAAAHIMIFDSLTWAVVSVCAGLAFLAVALYGSARRGTSAELTSLRHFRAARDFLQRRLVRGEEIDPRWVPYILALDLAPQLDRWFVVRPPSQPPPRSAFPAELHAGHPSSGMPAQPPFQPGGGMFGGAGATGSWVALSSFAQSIPAPRPEGSSSSSSGSSWSSSSSSSSRSSSSGSSRSGGGGGGGW